MKRVKVDLYGKLGQRITEGIPRGFPTRPVSRGRSTPAPTPVHCGDHDTDCSWGFARVKQMCDILRQQPVCDPSPL